MYLDLFLLILLVWAILSGWRHGFIKELIHTGGVIGGLLLAAVLYVVLGRWLTVDGSEANQVLSIIAFLILCIIMPLALGFVASSLTTMVRGMRLGLPNSLLGSAVSVVKFALLISFALNMMGNLNILNAERTAGSRLYAPTTALLPFVQTKAEDAIKCHQQSLAGKNDTTYIYFNRPSQPDDEHAQ